MNAPEKLSWWDSLFNRTRREVISRGEETWTRTPRINGLPIHSQSSTYSRNYVDYRIIDRPTGGETIERDYLN